MSLFLLRRAYERSELCKWKRCKFNTNDKREHTLDFFEDDDLDDFFIFTVGATGFLPFLPLVLLALLEDKGFLGCGELMLLLDLLVFDEPIVPVKGK